ncbi:hypothetical protein RUND412_007246 [Rhizina undulata]
MAAEVVTEAAELALEVADLTRKLRTAQALLSYRQRCAETELLKGEDDHRNTRSQLLILEAHWEHVSKQRAEDQSYISGLEDAILEADADNKYLEKVRQTAVSRLTRTKERVKALEEHVRTIEAHDKTSSARLAFENSALSLKMSELQIEHAELQQRLRMFQTKLEEASAKKLDAESKVMTQMEEIVSLQNEVKALKGSQDDRLKKVEDIERKRMAEMQDLERELESSTSKLESLMKELKSVKQNLLSSKEELETVTNELKTVKQELSASKEKYESLEKELESKTETIKKFSDIAGSKDESTKRTTQELFELRASLKRETKAKVKAESTLEKAKEDHEAQIAALESKLENMRTKLKSSSELNGAKVAFENPLKRPMEQALTLEDLEHTVKKPRKKTPPRTSSFSITPFLKKQVQVLPSTSPETPRYETSGEQTTFEDADEKSIMVPSVVESKEPTRILLAGVTRKKKSKPTEPIPPLEEEPEEEGDSLPVSNPPIKSKGKGRTAASKSKTVRENSLELEGLEEPEPELPVTKPEGKAPASKPKPKPKPKKPQASLELEGVLSEQDKDESLKEIERGKPLEKEKPKRRRKRPTETGIKPTIFGDDDGTGRLTLDIDADSQPKSKAASKSRKAPAKAVVGNKLADVMDGADMLAPVVSAFNKDFSPAKKRPDALRKLFGAGKK